MAWQILLIEDEGYVGEAVATTLCSQGWTVRQASTGSEARALAARYPPDLILLDLNLPDCNGWTLLQALREGARAPQVPVVVISALPVTRSDLRRHGARTFIPKPLSMPHLLATVQGLLGEPA